MPRYATYAVPRLDLGMAFHEYSFTDVNYIGLECLPLMPVDLQAATFAKITRESLLRNEDATRGQGGDYNRTNYAAEDDTYVCKEYGLEHEIKDDERSKYANDFDADAVGAEFLTNQLMRIQEKRIADLLFNATTFSGFTGQTASNVAWATAATANPQADVLAAQEIVRSNTGLEPRSMAIGKATYYDLLRVDEIADRIQYTAVPTVAAKLAILADYLNLDEVLVGDAVYNSADEGLAHSGSDIWSTTYALVFVKGSGPLSNPGLGRTMLWRADSPTNITFEQYRDEPRRQDIIRARQHTDEEVFDAAFGYLIDVANTT